MGKRILDWWKAQGRILLLLKAVLIALLPLLCVLVRCAGQGMRLGDVYLPASEWNDELIYYKQVEGMLAGGFPYGYFGFNESHALKLSFAAWSPALLLPWTLWGALFGWNLLSPLSCNLCMLSLAAGGFVLLTRPTWKQTGILGFLMCLFTPFSRFVLSAMPEIVCISLLILFYGVAIRYLERRKGWMLALLFALGVFGTLMRPYLVLFLFLPVFLWARRSGLKGLLFGAAAVALTGGAYLCIHHFLGAAYFQPLFFTDWVTAFFERGFFGGCYYFVWKLYAMGRQFVLYAVEGFRSGLTAGAYFGGYVVMLAVLLWQSLADVRALRRGKGEVENRLIPELHFTFCLVGMLAALLLMYKLTEGSRHLLTFLGVGIFLVSRMETRFYKKVVLIGATFAYLYSYRAVNPYDYRVPCVTQELSRQSAYWQEKLGEELVLQKERVPDFSNTMIWVLSDSVDGELTPSRWQILYGLPEGFGISCCEGAYVREHLESLQSRYLAVVCGGEIDALCGEAGYREIGRDEETVVYQRY